MSITPFVENCHCRSSLNGPMKGSLAQRNFWKDLYLSKSIRTLQRTWQCLSGRYIATKTVLLLKTPTKPCPSLNFCFHYSRNTTLKSKHGTWMLSTRMQQVDPRCIKSSTESTNYMGRKERKMGVWVSLSVTNRHSNPSFGQIRKQWNVEKMTSRKGLSRSPVDSTTRRMRCWENWNGRWLVQGWKHSSPIAGCYKAIVKTSPRLATLLAIGDFSCNLLPHLS